MGESPSPQPSAVEGEGDGVPPGMGSRLHGNDGCVWHGGVTLTPRIEYGAGSSTGSGQAPPSAVEGEGDGVPPGMGSRLHGNDGWHGESPSPQPSPVEGEGDGVPPGMGSRLHGNDGCVWGVTLTPALSRRGREGRRAAGDGFPFARERRLAWGVTLTPALSRRGRGGRHPHTPPPAFSHRGRGGSEPSPGPWVPAPACAGACLNGNDGWDGWHCATVVLVVAPLERVAAATTLSDVRVPPSHRLEALRGKREGQHSIRINDQWRVCFRWTDQGAMEIEVTDYH